MTKGLNDWFPVFRAGTHADSKGRKKTYTISDLDKIVENYQSSNSDFQEAPCVLGHPKNNDASYGWIEAVKREGNTLFAKCKDLVSEFSEAVQDGRFPNRSISLTPDLRINHLGFLGAVQPAIKGLGKIEFSESQELETYEYMDFPTANRFEDVGNILQGLRDFLIEKYDLDTANKALSQYVIDYLKDAKANTDTPQEAIAAYCENFKEELNVTTKTTNSNSDYSEELKTKNDEIALLKTENEKLLAEGRKKELNSFCEELIKEGRLLPAEKSQALDYMEIMHEAGNFEFSEGEKKSALENFKTFLKKRPVQINFSEMATGDFEEGDEVNAQSIAQKALNYQQEQAKSGIVIRIDEAVEKIFKD
jgi:hypothetical protein